MAIQLIAIAILDGPLFLHKIWHMESAQCWVSTQGTETLRGTVERPERPMPGTLVYQFMALLCDTIHPGLDNLILIWEPIQWEVLHSVI